MKVSYPAKIILFGEHTIVYKDSIACLSAVDLFTTADYEKSSDNHYTIVFNSKTFNVATTFTAKEATNIFNKCQSLHQVFLQSGDISELKNLIKGKGNFFKLIIGFLLTKYSKIAPINIKIHTKAPLGSGMGTSASIAAVVIKSVLDFNALPYTNETLLTLTKDMEDMQHGRASGADPAAVIYGGLIKFEHLIDDRRVITSITKNNEWSKDLYLILSGNPSESTGEMVSKVREYGNKNSKEFKLVLKQINQIVNDFILSDKPDMPDLINSNGILLEQLGVVSDKCKAYSKEVRKAGGAVKIAGAGGVSSGSGICLVYLQDLTLLHKLLDKYSYTLIPAHFIT
jgi:mevalonate kinase